jgi:predicted DNA-binding protein
MEMKIMKGKKKIAVQIYLEPEQERILKALSKTTGKSKAAIIRSCISKSLADVPPESDPAMNIINLGSSGERDISEKHDDHLY